MAPARIVCVGGARLERVFAVPAIPDAPIKVQATGYRAACGGVAARAALAVVARGGDARLWARVGDDADGAWLVAALAAGGVDTGAVAVISGARSASAAVIGPAGAPKLRAAYTGVGLAPPPGWPPPEVLADAAAVLVDVTWPEVARALLARARAAGLPALLAGQGGIAADLAADAACIGAAPAEALADQLLALAAGNSSA
jgi:sulfofructose kinase